MSTNGRLHQRNWYYCESKDFTDKVDDYFIYFPRGFDRQEVDRVISVESVCDES